MMEECTFTPKVAYPKTVKTNSSGSSESVFDRLYNSESNRSTPITSNMTNRRRTPSTETTSPTTNSTVTSTVMSGRLESIYERGVRKMRARPVNDTAERDLRELRTFEKELSECTFHPQKQNNTKKTGNCKRSKLIMEPSIRRPKHSRRKHPFGSPQPEPPIPPSLPLEIVVPNSSIDVWETPPRRDRTSNEYSMISPLKEPFVVEDTCPRVLTSSPVQTAATEYGSI